MVTVPLSQPYIPKTMGQMVWVCGTAVAWPGTLGECSLKNIDLPAFFGTALGTAKATFDVFVVSQPFKNSNELGQRANLRICRGKIRRYFRQSVRAGDRARG
jgi:hypothetical protein